MLHLKRGDQLIWPDLLQIEAPFMASRTLSAHLQQGVGSTPIINDGAFTLPDGKHFGIQQDVLNTQLEQGQAFLVNSQTQHQLLKSVQDNPSGKIEWTSAYDLNPMLKNALSSALLNVDPPGYYVYSDTKTRKETAEPTQTTPNKQKHKIKFEVELEKNCLYPKEYRITLHIIGQTDHRSIKQNIDLLTIQESKVFSLAQQESFEAYPVRETMKDVKNDFIENASYSQSISNGRIQALVVDRTETQGDVTVHVVKFTPPPILRMGCFFDGTGNDDTDPERFSNVKILSDSYKDKIDKLNDSFSHGYMRGVGTEADGFFGEILGAAAGIGALKRVAGMIHNIEKAVTLYFKAYKVYPEFIYFDVFGFSRGATTSRHFMNVLKQGFYGFKDTNIQQYVTPDNLMISFAGLFDSVGSYGIAGDNEDYGYNFHIHPNWLTEDGQVVHFIALNEYRKNFDLQTVFEGQSRSYPMNMQKGHMQELGFIGAHSDIGGGYGPNEQGVMNTSTNQTQLSVITLGKMHDIATLSGVPLSPLPTHSIDSLLKQHYEVIERYISDPQIRRLWMEWSEHKKAHEIFTVLFKRIQSKPDNLPRKNFLKRRLRQSSSEKDRLETRLKSIMGDTDAQKFIASFEYIDKYYIHESHAPFNSTIGMSAEKNESEMDVVKLTRTVYFKPAVDFKQRNKDLDRIHYRRGRPKKVDIDEFDFVMAEAFK